MTKVIGWNGDVLPIHTGAKAESGSTHYFGSIILSPTHGDKCHKRRIDNRTGAVRSEGLVDCDVVPSLKQLRERGDKRTIGRLRLIGDAFSHGN